MLSCKIKYFIIFLFIFMAPGANAVEPSGDLTLLTTEDKTRVYAHFYRAMNNNQKIALLFHQAGSNSMEYEPVLSAFHLAGFDTLTLDQRSGGTRWGVENLTVKRLGASTDYAEAYPDLEAALEYAVKHKYKKILVVGSSYSASLAIVLASNNPDKIMAVAAFSPGEYFPDKNWIKNATAKLKIPLYITSTDKERQRSEEVIVRANENDIDVTYYRPLDSVHGISTLRKGENPDGYKINQDNFAEFLNRFK
ncbi:MAG: alpha/beta hydrolase [Arenicellales bacterium]